MSQDQSLADRTATPDHAVAAAKSRKGVPLIPRRPSLPKSPAARYRALLEDLKALILAGPTERPVNKRPLWRLYHQHVPKPPKPKQVQRHQPYKPKVHLWHKPGVRYGSRVVPIPEPEKPVPPPPVASRGRTIRPVGGFPR